LGGVEEFTEARGSHISDTLAGLHAEDARKDQRITEQDRRIAALEALVAENSVGIAAILGALKNSKAAPRKAARGRGAKKTRAGG
jgi:hypothetical protein